MWLQGLNVSTFLKAPMYSMIQYLSCPTSWHHWTWKQHKTGGLFNFCYPALFWLMGPFSLLSTSAKPDLEALTLSFNWHKMQWEKRKCKIRQTESGTKRPASDGRRRVDHMVTSVVRARNENVLQHFGGYKRYNNYDYGQAKLKLLLCLQFNPFRASGDYTGQLIMISGYRVHKRVNVRSQKSNSEKRLSLCYVFPMGNNNVYSILHSKFHFSPGTELHCASCFRQGHITFISIN